MPSASSGSSKGKTAGPTSPKDDTFCVAACFAKSRGWVAGSPMSTKDKTGMFKCKMLWKKKFQKENKHAKIFVFSSEHTRLFPVTIILRSWGILKFYLSEYKVVYFSLTDDKVVDSLYICNWMGNVVEYVLEPRAKMGSEKVTDDSPLDVDESARAQWILSRSVMLHNSSPWGPFELTQKQGCHGTGKTGNLKVNFSRQGKHREFAKKY